jgi:hypothetical protein
MAQGESKGQQFATRARVKATNQWGAALPGVLALDGKRLVFVELGSKITLDADIDECEFSFSKWMMGQGFVVKTPEKKYSVGFAKIGSFVAGDVLRAAGLESLGFGVAMPGIASVMKAPQLCKQWKEVLTEAGAL